MVEAVFDQLRDVIVNDPLFNNVTHIIGHSIGTMLACRAALDLCQRNSGKKVETALIQVGTSWQEALAHTRARFAYELRKELTHRNLTFDDFSEILKEYNPDMLVDELAELIVENRLDLSLFIGLGDKLIYPSTELIFGLLEKFNNSKASGLYSAYLSKTAGHYSSPLFFLWLMTQKQTIWSRILGIEPTISSIDSRNNMDKTYGLV